MTAAAIKKWAEQWHISSQSYFWIQPSKTVLASKAYYIVRMMLDMKLGHQHKS